jgi:hypothetical protein
MLPLCSSPAHDHDAGEAGHNDALAHIAGATVGICPPMPGSCRSHGRVPRGGKTSQKHCSLFRMMWDDQRYQLRRVVEASQPIWGALPRRMAY